MSKKEIGLEGIQVGLKAFIITYTTAIFIAMIMNLTVIEKIQDYLQGTLRTDVGFSFGLVIKTAVLIMNMSLFNTTGHIQIGILVLVVLPLFGFFLAGRRENMNEGMDKVGFLVYGVASTVYSIFLIMVSFIGRGELLGLNIDFVSIRNGVMTFIITFLIQMVIGINYDVNRLPGVIAVRWMVRLSLGITFILSFIGVIYFLAPYTKNPLAILAVVLLFVPNIVVYLIFTMMGVGIEVNTSFGKFLEAAHLDLSYTAIPMGMKIGLLLLFIGIMLFAMSRIKREVLIKGLIGFALLYPLINILAAYCTVINLGRVKIIGEIRFGIGYFQAFIYPLIWVVILGVLTISLRHMVHVLKEVK